MVTPIHNSGALTLHRSLTRNTQAADQSAERLSTGLRINAGKDDPAGLISSERLRAVLATLDAETRVLQRQGHVAATAEAVLGEVSGVLAETQALEVRLADGTLSDSERDALRMQIDANRQSIDRIADTAAFNGTRLFSGDLSLAYAGDTLDLPRLDAETILADGTDAGIDTVATLRGTIGAYQADTIEPALANTRTAMENTAAAESVIRDTDYAEEMIALNRAALLGGATMQAFASVSASGAAVLDLLG